MLSVRAIVEGNQLHFLDKIIIEKPQNVIVTFLENNNADFLDMNSIAQNSGALDFLNNTEEDIYTDADLKIKLK